MKNESNFDILSIGQAATLLGVHIDTIRNWEKRGLLIPKTTLGGHRRYSKSELENIKGNKMSDQIVNRWASIGILEGITQEHRKRVAVSLENQRIFNESNELPVRFRRVSIPMVRRVLGTLSEFHYAIYHRDEELNPHVTNIKWNPEEQMSDLRALDVEAEWTAAMSHEVKQYIESKIAEGYELKFKAFTIVDGFLAIAGLDKA